MKWLTFITQSIRFYYRQYLALFLGTALSAAVLVGALLTGNSVTYSLRRLVDKRLAKIEYALELKEHFFTTAMADSLEALLKTGTAPVLKLKGIVVDNQSGLIVNDVQVLGVDSRFWDMSSNLLPDKDMESNQAILNTRLAARLNTGTGDNLVLLIEQIDLMPKDTPFSADQDTASLQLKIKTIRGEDHLGLFSLSNNQVSPLTVFVALDVLQNRLNLGNKANLLLVAQRAQPPLAADELKQALESTLSLADLGLEIKHQPHAPYFDLVSQRVFLEPALEQAVETLDYPRQPILTYFVNSLSLGRNSTPYSFVSAPGPPLVPKQLNDNEIIISGWLAQDLDADVGDEITLSYFIPGQLNTLEERASSFLVHSILNIAPDGDERSLTPQYSGLADVENCRDWHPGIPIYLSKIRKKDEEYWDTYRGTPKAFVSLTTAQKLWQNRFGKVTGIRFFLKHTGKIDLTQELLKNIAPAALGFVFRPVREQGLQASRGAVDFGQLFIGLSFFIIISALSLSALLFIFHRQSRLTEMGILKAVGIHLKAIQRAALVEGAGVAFIATAFGLVLGIIYTQMLITGLNTIWQGAVGQTSLLFFIHPLSLLLGFCLNFCGALFFLWWTLRNYVRKEVHVLQANTLQYNPPLVKGSPLIGIVITCICFLGCSVLIIATAYNQELTTAFFFIIGALMLCAFMFILNTLFTLLGTSKSRSRLNLLMLGLNNAARRKKRSMATIGLLAVGIFCVVAVGLNQQELPSSVSEASSGTGGFSLYAETTLPLLHDLNQQSVKNKLHLDDSSLTAASYVNLRVYPGDDASCLNLNHTASPRLLGVNPEEFARRKSFSFEISGPEMGSDNPWLALDEELGADIIPAVADQTVIVWGLGKKIGDELGYINEHGKEIRVKLIGGLRNSIFQGSIIISEKHFLRHFPGISGYNLLLVNGITRNPDRARSILYSSLKAYGAEVITTAERLARFYVVENTYLMIFLMLGGLGLLIATAGFGVIILRNVAESRGEYALLSAVGFNQKSIALVILYEHIFLLIAGIASGTLAAGIALIPHFIRALPHIPLYLTGLLLLSLLASGIFWSYLGIKTALKDKVLSALRTE